MAEVCTAALGLAASSSSPCLGWQGECPTAAMAPRGPGALEGWEQPGCLSTREVGRTCGAGWRCFLTPALKSCRGGFQLPGRASHPKGAPRSVSVLSLAAVPSTRAVSALEPGQQLRVEAVPSSSLLDLRQKSY